MEPCRKAEKTIGASSTIRIPSRQGEPACKSGTEFYSLGKSPSRDQSKSPESSSLVKIELADESSLRRSSGWICTGTDSSRSACRR